MTFYKRVQTTLAGVLIFITIERKLDLGEIENTISRLERDMEIDERKAKELYDEKPYGWKEELKKLDERHTNLRIAMGQAEERRFKSRTQIGLKNLEDLVTFITLSLLTSCLIFLILVEQQWTYYFLNYSLVSRILFSAGLIFLLFRVALRAKD